VSEEFDRLVEIMVKLRGPDGCPWDKEQTVRTLKKYLLEETYDLLEALEENDIEEIKSELGDLLFQIIFLSQIFSEKGDFSIKEVVNNISEKMIRRHAHIFGDKSASNSKEVLSIWEEEKKRENNEEAHRSLLAGIPKHQPALLRAQQISSRVAHVGFEWESTEDIIEKMKEEINELSAALTKQDKQEAEEEIGDLLFTLVNIARHMNIDSEFTLHKTCEKFKKRWRYIEKSLEQKGKKPDECDIEELESLWQRSKEEL